MNRGRIPVVTAAASSSQTPATILGANLLRWLKASSAASDITISTGVSKWWDRSSNLYHVIQSTAGSQPAYEAGGYNGYPSVLFDGTNDFLRNEDIGVGAYANALIGGTDKAFTLWFAVQFLATSDEQLWSASTTAAALPHAGCLYSSTSGQIRVTKRDLVNPQKNIDAAGSSLNRMILTFTSDGTRGEIRFDNVVVAAFAAANYDTDAFSALLCDAIGALFRSTTSLFFTGRVAEKVARSGAASEAEHTAMYSYFQSAFSNGGLPMVIYAGDSMSLPSSYPAQVTSDNSATVVNVAVGGSLLGGTLGGLANQLAQVTSNWDGTRPINAVFGLWGSNDIALSHRTAAQLAADYQSWISIEKAAHPTRKLCVGTVIRRGGSSPISGADETERVAFNTDIRANYATWGADALLDRDVIQPEAPTDLTVFNADEIHPNSTGYGYWCTGRNGAQGVNAILTGWGFT